MIVAHWKCNDNAASTTVIDSVGTANGVYTDNATGVNTSTGSVASGSGVGTALDLDTDEWINIGNAGMTVKSISLWAKPDSVTVVTTNFLDLNGTDYFGQLNGTIVGAAFATYVVYVNGELGTTITTDWNHIVITSTGGGIASDLDIGRLEAAGPIYSNGLKDNVMLFDTTLNIDQVKALYNGGRGTEIPAVTDIDRRIQRR